MANLFIKGAVSSYIGVSRKNNEDNYFLNGKYAQYDDDNQNSSAFQPLVQSGIFGIFDGMGGQSKGEFASFCAAKTLQKYQEDMLNDPHHTIDHYVNDVNRQICHEMNRIQKQIGSTMAILRIQNGIADAYNLGDSCIYHLSGNILTKLSYDHTVAEQLYRNGLLTRTEVRKDIRRHQLTKHLGILSGEEHLKVHRNTAIRITNGDMFLLCTDGISDTLSENDIKMIMQQSDGKCRKAVEMMIQKAVEKGSSDNITAIVLKVVKRMNKNHFFSTLNIDKHPHTYSFILGTIVTAIFFIIVIIIILTLF
ncbi:MAG: serine/threonine-protein phosphatase [Clostridia bacterium]|nr:serine/threonine-protein phosphatase [Clostridia bacterium]